MNRLREAGTRDASRAFLAAMGKRRSIRHFSDEPVAFEFIENKVRVAGCAPSDANQQPWSYVIVSDRATRQRMRGAIERKEYETYTHRASPEWCDAFAPLGTDWEKEHIVRAPSIVVVFAQAYGSVGFFLASLTCAGLAHAHAHAQSNALAWRNFGAPG